MRYPVFGLLTLLNTCIYANAIQFFTGLNYNNPAQLFQVQSNDVIVGSVISNVHMIYDGLAFDVNTFGYDTGIATTHKTSMLPYGRFAHRVNDKLVLDVDVSEPYFSNLNWGDNSFMRFVNTQNYVTNYDVSPRFSWAVNKSLFVGAGLDIYIFDNVQLNFAEPTGPTQYGTMVNRMSGNKLAYDVGAYYLINQSNFIGITYFAPFTVTIRGQSFIVGTDLVSSNLSSPVPLPATTVVSYTNLISKEWLTSWSLYYSDWSTLHNIYLNSTAVGDLVFPTNYHGSVAVVGVVRHQFTEKIGVSLIGAVDTNPVPTLYRSPALPSYNQFFLALSAELQCTKDTTLQIMYGHAVSNPRIDSYFTLPNGVTMPLTRGNVSITPNVVDLRIKISV